MEDFVPPDVAMAGPVTEAAAVTLVQQVLRRLLRATTPEEAVSELVGLVYGLGGRTVPATLENEHVLPMDLSMGVLPEPLLPAADPYSAARLHLETHLPGLLEDVRAVVSRLDKATQSEHDAAVDPLTGLLNRRGSAGVYIQGHDGDTVAMLDLDHFKALNDTHGHEAGDRVLRDFAECLRGSIREADVACRMGGEEFMLYLPSTDGPTAAGVLGRVRTRWLAVRSLPVTFSAGVADVGEDGVETALAVADAALYRAKEAGRDRIKIAGQETT
ncbi:MAG: GGDEF domain-containing protein [Egibacteraceae bacterium]